MAATYWRRLLELLIRQLRGNHTHRDMPPNLFRLHRNKFFWSWLERIFRSHIRSPSRKLRIDNLRDFADHLAKILSGQVATHFRSCDFDTFTLTNGHHHDTTDTGR